MKHLFAVLFSLLAIFAIRVAWIFAFLVMGKCLIEIILGYPIISFSMCAAIAVGLGAIKMIF